MSLHFHDTAQDLRISLRRMWRAPALATGVILTIGVGLGVATAIFTTSEAALVEPLPYAEPERLVHLWEGRVATDERGPTSFATLADWRARVASFSALEGYDPTNITVGLEDESRPLRGARLTPGFFRLLGVTPSTGRDFDANEDATSGSAVVMVSDRFARSVPAMTPGHIIRINGMPHMILGVLPPSFHFAALQNADIFVPFTQGEQSVTDRTRRSLHVVGRLRHGVPLARARAELSTVMSILASENPDALTGRTVVAIPLRDALLGNMKIILGWLLVAVALLLAIMAANLAFLMLTRYVARVPELALRSALGATRARVLRQLLVESLVPTVAGAVLATIIGQASTRALLTVIPDVVRVNMPYLMDVGLDWRVVAVIIVIAVMMATAFGLGPALFITYSSERGGDLRHTAGRGDRRLLRGLVAAQIALAFVLLVSAGLLIRSFSNLVRRDVGFRDPATLVSVRVPLSGQRYETPRAQRQLYEELLSQAVALPEVRDAALINEVPGGGGGYAAVQPLDRPSQSPATQPRVVMRIIGGTYFRTMGIPVVEGRVFEPRDRDDTPRTAVVSASFARMLHLDGATVGRRLRLSATDTSGWEVIGVVGDVQVAALDADTPPVIYLSHLQQPENRMTLVLRTTSAVVSIASQLRAVVKRLDPGIPVYAAARLDQQLSESKAIFSRRFPMILSGVFAVAALALTLVALYAMSTHEVQTRSREFGIRLALGASPDAIRRSILGDALLLGVVGVGLGSIVAIAVARSMRALLYSVTPVDWRVFGAVGASVLVFTALTALRPALRAGSVDPSVVLREQ